MSILSQPQPARNPSSVFPWRWHEPWQGHFMDKGWRTHPAWLGTKGPSSAVAGQPRPTEKGQRASFGHADARFGTDRDCPNRGTGSVYGLRPGNAGLKG